VINFVWDVLNWKVISISILIEKYWIFFVFDGLFEVKFINMDLFIFFVK